jgi:Methyltransferase domain
MTLVEPIVLISDRNLLGYALNKSGFVGKGCEIGVQEGKFSEILLETWQGKKLFSIDPWRHFAEEEYLDIANREQAVQDKLCEATRQRLAPYGERSVILRKTSKEAAATFADGELDFAYIDAQHSYTAAREDMHLWFPKIKPGGLLIGHDYIPDGIYAFGEFGVKQAVDEFAAERNLQVFISGEVSPNPKIVACPSWFLIKNRK